MPSLTESNLDHLALQACEFIGFKSGATVPYDPAGYDRSHRLQLTPGSIPIKDGQIEQPRPLPAQAVFSEQPYPSRIAGFQRRDIFGPDEIGELISNSSIPWNDGLGNGLYESLRIDRKYGLRHALEAPVLGFPLPYLEKDWPAFKATYSKYVENFLSDLKELEPIYGGPLAHKGERLMVLWCPHYPLSLFSEAYFNEPQLVENDLQQSIDFPGLPISPQNSTERAAQSRFWALIRSRQAKVIAYQAEVLRKRMGPGLLIASNPHELPPLDMELQGQVYDYPAVAIRPLLLDDDVFLKNYVAYFTQFNRDLTMKPPLVSVRINLSAASPRFVPTGNLIRSWYDQAVRHGAGAFYFWTRDYPYSDAPGIYDGPIPGNPEASCLGTERWDASLDVLGRLATHRRFIPPPAAIGILIPNDSALLYREEWRRIYAVFSACCEARIHTCFLSDRRVSSSGIPSHIGMVIAPALEFVSDGLRTSLETYTAAGGKVILMDSPLFDSNGNPVKILAGAESINANLDIFPLDRKAELGELLKLAEYLQNMIDASKLEKCSWVFDISCANLPESQFSLLKPPDPRLQFSPWLYEHGSPWITPYL